MWRGSARIGLFLLALLVASAAPARAQSICDPDAYQASGSIYRICMPAAGYNGVLVIWAHGFQDAGTPVSIPENQLCFSGFCIPDLINGLGFAFATNSYSKTGLAVEQGKADIADLVQIFAAQRGQPAKVYLVGASEGGLITALNVEQRPDLFSAGIAACGPVGDFPLQINYFGDARATFDYFFPGVIPGDPFKPDPGLIAAWPQYFQTVVVPTVFNPANRHKLDQWVKVANLPYDSQAYLASVALSVQDALRYSVVNINDAAATLGGFPFENRYTWYHGSDNDLWLNLRVRRVAADAKAIQRMRNRYNTTGNLAQPLITMHTLRDQQVPFIHEPLYDVKTLRTGSLLTRHVNIPVDRFGHCNFNRDEVLLALATMLFYDGRLDLLSGLPALMSPSELSAFTARAQAAGMPLQPIVSSR